MKAEVIKFERYRNQFAFLRENDISTQEDLTAFQTRTEDKLASLTRQRTILNVRKKKRRPFYTALSNAVALAQAKVLYEEGLSGMEAEFSRYMEAVAVLDQCGVPQERLTTEKTELYEQLAQINSGIRAARRELAMCQEIQGKTAHMEQDIRRIENERDTHSRQRNR